MEWGLWGTWGPPVVRALGPAGAGVGLEGMDHPLIDFYRAL